MVDIQITLPCIVANGKGHGQLLGEGIKKRGNQIGPRVFYPCWVSVYLRIS